MVSLPPPPSTSDGYWSFPQTVPAPPAPSAISSSLPPPPPRPPHLASQASTEIVNNYYFTGAKNPTVYGNFSGSEAGPTSAGSQGSSWMDTLAELKNTMAIIRSSQDSQASTLAYLLKAVNLRPATAALAQGIPPPPPGVITSGSTNPISNLSQSPMSAQSTSSMPYHDSRSNRYGSQWAPPGSGGTTAIGRGMAKNVQFFTPGDNSREPFDNDSYMPRDRPYQSSNDSRIDQMRQGVQNFANGYNGSNGYPSTHDRAYPSPHRIGSAGYTSQQSHQPHVFQGPHNSTMSGMSQMVC